MSDQKYERGFVVLSRDLLDSSLWNLPPEHFRVAVYLLLKARHKDSIHLLPDGTTVGRGELVTSMLLIAENCAFYENRTTRELSRKKVLNILVDLEKLGFIDRNSHRKGTHISICNYGSYQDIKNYKSHKEETNREHTGNTEGTQTATNKKGNKEKNDNNEKTTPKSPRGLITFAVDLVECDIRKEIVKEWLEFRISLKKPMKTEAGIKKMISEWSKYSNDQVRTAVNRSISKEYQGVFFNDTEQPTNTKRVTKDKDYGEGWNT